MSEIVSVIDLAALLTSIDGDNPAGESLRWDGSTYDQINEARREDEVLPQGVWERELKVADWPRVIQLTTNALLKKTKDLQLAVWLTEGIVKHDKHDRWVGLHDGLQLLFGLHENFWETIYPEIDPEDEEGPLVARANVLAAFDTRIAAIIKEIPLTAGAKYSYLQYLEAKQFDIPENLEALDFSQQERFTALRAKAEAEKRITGEDWRKAKAATSRDFIEDRAALIRACWEQCKALDAVMDAKFAHETPGLGEFKKSLEEIRSTVDLIVKEKQKAEPREDKGGAEDRGEAGEAVVMSADGGGGFAVSSGAVSSRREALRHLAEIAEFFRHTEPHSPVAYAVQRAVKWGNMSLEVWLADVVKDEATLGLLRETLGLNTGSSNEE